MSYMVHMISVSYTHLDVYKRQLLVRHFIRNASKFVHPFVPREIYIVYLCLGHIQNELYNTPFILLKYYHLNSQYPLQNININILQLSKHNPYLRLFYVHKFIYSKQPFCSSSRPTFI